MKFSKTTIQGVISYDWGLGKTLEYDKISITSKKITPKKSKSCSKFGANYSNWNGKKKVNIYSSFSLRGVWDKAFTNLNSGVVPSMKCQVSFRTRSQNKHSPKWAKTFCCWEISSWMHTRSVQEAQELVRVEHENLVEEEWFERFQLLELPEAGI